MALTAQELLKVLISATNDYLKQPKQTILGPKRARTINQVANFLLALIPANQKPATAAPGSVSLQAEIKVEAKREKDISLDNLTPNPAHNPKLAAAPVIVNSFERTAQIFFVIAVHATHGDRQKIGFWGKHKFCSTVLGDTIAKELSTYVTSVHNSNNEVIQGSTDLQSYIDQLKTEIGFYNLDHANIQALLSDKEQLETSYLAVIQKLFDIVPKAFLSSEFQSKFQNAYCAQWKSEGTVLCKAKEIKDEGDELLPQTAVDRLSNTHELPYISDGAHLTEKIKLTEDQKQVVAIFFKDMDLKKIAPRLNEKFLALRKPDEEEIKKQTAEKDTINNKLTNQLLSGPDQDALRIARNQRLKIIAQHKPQLEIITRIQAVITSLEEVRSPAEEVKLLLLFETLKNKYFLKELKLAHFEPEQRIDRHGNFLGRMGVSSITIEDVVLVHENSHRDKYFHIEICSLLYAKLMNRTGATSKQIEEALTLLRKDLENIPSERHIHDCLNNAVCSLIRFSPVNDRLYTLNTVLLVFQECFAALSAPAQRNQQEVAVAAAAAPISQTSGTFAVLPNARLG